MVQNVSAVPVPGACPDYIDVADNDGVLERSSAVTSAAEQDTTSGAWVYRYRVCNTTDPYYAGTGGNVIVDWELPYFDDGGFTLADVITPIGWRASIEMVGTANPDTGWGVTDTNGDGVVNDADAVPAWSLDGDPWKEIFDLDYDVANGGVNPFTNVQKVLHFYSESFFDRQEQDTLAAVVAEDEFCGIWILENESCAGFGFSSTLEATDAPYQASWARLPVRTGDPLFPLGPAGGIPNAPSLQATIPEPATAALIGVGLLSVAAQRRRRRKQ